MASGATIALYSISGCAVNTPAKSQNGLENELRSYVGRMSLVIEPGTGASADAQSFSGGFELRGKADSGELDLLTPLGSIVMQLRWQPGSAVILRGTERQQFSSAQALLEQATGAALTLSQLFQWLQGNAGEPSILAQSSGWQVDLSGQPQGRIIARRSLPSPAVLRIVLERP